MGVSRAGASVAHPRAHPRSLPLQARSECLGGRRIAATTLQEHLIATLTAPRLHEGSISHRMTSLPSAPASNPFLRPCRVHRQWLMKFPPVGRSSDRRLKKRIERCRDRLRGALHPSTQGLRRLPSGGRIRRSWRWISTYRGAIPAEGRRRRLRFPPGTARRSAGRA